MPIHSSSWLPWLFMGPLLLGIAGWMLYRVTGMPVFALLAKLGIFLMTAVGVAAFSAHWRMRRRIGNRDTE